VLIHAAAVVDNLELDAAVVHASLHLDDPAAGHGLLGVEGQVHQHLAKERAVEANRRQVGGQRRADIDPVGGGFRLAKRDEVTNHLVQVALHELELTHPGELQEVFENRLQPAALALHGDDLLEHAAIAWRVAPGDIFAQKLEVQTDRRERILDFMRETTGESGDLGKPGGQPRSFGLSQQCLDGHESTRENETRFQEQETGFRETTISPKRRKRFEPVHHEPDVSTLASSASTALRDSLTRFWSSTAITLTCMRSP